MKILFTVLQKIGTAKRVTVAGDVAIAPPGWGIIARVGEGEAFVQEVWRTETIGAPPVSHFSHVVQEKEAFS